jgi:tetratricopeptide (TPR) repeat protein
LSACKNTASLLEKVLHLLKSVSSLQPIHWAVNKSSFVWFLLGIIVQMNACKDQDLPSGSEVVSEAPALDPELSELNRRVRSEPRNPEHYHSRARYYLRHGQYEPAMVDLRSLFSLDTGRADYFLTAAEVYIKLGAFSQADDALAVATRKDPKLANAHVKRGELAFMNKKYNSAMFYLNEGLKADIHHADGYFWKGMVHLEQGKREQAESAFLTCMEQEPEHTEAMMQLGLLHQYDNSALAYRYFSNVIRVDSNYLEALYARGTLLQDQGYPDSARQDYQLMLTRHPAHPDALFNLGYTYLLEGNYPESVRWFDRLIASDPAHYRALQNRGLAYEQSGQKEKALADFKQVLKIEPGYDKALEAINRMK